MTAPLWTRGAARTATGGTAQGPDWRAGGVSIDSRTLVPGDLFVAIKGPAHDGHDHVAAALENGAAAALVHRIPAGLSADAPLLIVPDTLEGLRALARAARARSAARIVAVTGSVGKTGTKEMLKLALEQAGPTHVTEGNLNNHWGVPLSLARLPENARFAVFEMGMNHPGEITPLTTLVRPEVAIITSVEAVHMEFFASTADIARAKAEIFAGVVPGGMAILPRDNPHYGLLRRAAEAAGITRIEDFGTHIDATARLLDCGLNADSTAVFALLGEDAHSFGVGVAGRQWAFNSLAVLLAARAVGVPVADAAGALAAMRAPKGRGRRLRLTWGDGEIGIIDEAYNASPVSMKAAVATLAAARPAKAGRRVAVLGDMLELGAASAALHAGLAEEIKGWHIDLVFASGPLMRHLFDALPPAMRGAHADGPDALVPVLAAALKGGDVVMIKGSAGSRMGRVIDGLQERAAKAAEDK